MSQRRRTISSHAGSETGSLANYRQSKFKPQNGQYDNASSVGSNDDDQYEESVVNDDVGSITSNIQSRNKIYQGLSNKRPRYDRFQNVDDDNDNNNNRSNGDENDDDENDEETEIELYNYVAELQSHLKLQMLQKIHEYKTMQQLKLAELTEAGGNGTVVDSDPFLGELGKITASSTYTRIANAYTLVDGKIANERSVESTWQMLKQVTGIIDVGSHFTSLGIISKIFTVLKPFGQAIKSHETAIRSHIVNITSTSGPIIDMGPKTWFWFFLGCILLESIQTGYAELRAQQAHEERMKLGTVLQANDSRIESLQINRAAQESAIEALQREIAAGNTTLANLQAIRNQQIVDSTTQSSAPPVFYASSSGNAPVSATTDPNAMFSMGLASSSTGGSEPQQSVAAPPQQPNIVESYKSEAQRAARLGSGTLAANQPNFLEQMRRVAAMDASGSGNLQNKQVTYVVPSADLSTVTAQQLQNHDSSLDDTGSISAFPVIPTN